MTASLNAALVNVLQTLAVVMLVMLVFLGLRVAFITTISAFAPMFLLDGVSGEFAFALGAVVALMLSGSWLTAHYILPFLCVHLLKPEKEMGKPVENWFVKTYRGLITKMIPFGIPIILLAYLSVYLSSGVFGWLRSEQFPVGERNEYLIYLEMPKGTAISETEKEVLAVEQWLLNKEVNKEVVNTTVFVGDGGPRFYLSLSPADTNPACAFILVNTTSSEAAFAGQDRARKYLFAHHPAARFKVKRLSMGGSESGIVEIKIKGPDADHLLALAISGGAMFERWQP